MAWTKVPGRPAEQTGEFPSAAAKEVSRGAMQLRVSAAGQVSLRQGPLSGLRRLAAAAGCAAALIPAAARAQSVVLPELEVTTSPLPGAGIDRDKVPAMVQTLTADDFQRTYSPSVIETLLQRIPGVSTSDT